jgi:hypothetical protein
MRDEWREDGGGRNAEGGGGGGRMPKAGWRRMPGGCGAAGL